MQATLLRGRPLLPVNWWNTHWAVISIFPQQHQEAKQIIVHYEDSMSFGKQAYEACQYVVAWYIIQWSRYLDTLGIDADERHAKMVQPENFHIEGVLTPQSTSYDCGDRTIFKILQHFVNKTDVGKNQDFLCTFNEAGVENQRLWLAAALVSKRLRRATVVINDREDEEDDCTWIPHDGMKKKEEDFRPLVNSIRNHFDETKYRQFSTMLNAQIKVSFQACKDSEIAGQIPFSEQAMNARRVVRGSSQPNVIPFLTETAVQDRPTLTTAPKRVKLPAFASALRTNGKEEANGTMKLKAYNLLEFFEPIRSLNDGHATVDVTYDDSCIMLQFVITKLGKPFAITCQADGGSESQSVLAFPTAVWSVVGAEDIIMDCLGHLLEFIFLFSQKDLFHIIVKAKPQLSDWLLAIMTNNDSKFTKNASGHYQTIRTKCLPGKSK